ncbi:uncharacterized protein LOC131619184 [Vicia villosa]|uniref:uncharacterized protein LOC131619184 n=1 Tax=Vicia villosa TaxID=3911 RepID=UPI00273CCD4F|nr:uncharacterized protein LOC131619184 [Vicia villosa]
MERMHPDILKKSEEIDTLQKERMKVEEHADSFDKEVIQLHKVLEEKEQCILHHKEQEKKLEDQITENRSLLTAAESKLAEARNQYDQMVENKKLELSKHLKEISQRNDQAINDIKRKYELEKMEIVNMEKHKADKAIAEIEGRRDQKVAECKEESRQQLMHIQEEHTKLVVFMQIIGSNNPYFVFIEGNFEATDVAKVVLDVTDCVMLSGETTVRAYPELAVRTMAKICVEAESTIDYGDVFKRIMQHLPVPLSPLESLASSSVRTSLRTFSHALKNLNISMERSYFFSCSEKLEHQYGKISNLMNKEGYESAKENSCSDEISSPEADKSKVPLQLAILGRPNVGKSTLMNTLLPEDRVLVGPKAGLTRSCL